MHIKRHLGDEEAVRDFIVEQITPYVECITIDAMGNVIAEKKGIKPAKTKLMLNAAYGRSWYDCNPY